MARWLLQSVPLTLLLSLCVPPTLGSAQDATPLSKDPADGPIAVVGSWRPSNFASVGIYQQPMVALIDVSANLPLRDGKLAPKSSQGIGFPTPALVQQDAPTTYRVNPPVVPTAGAVSPSGADAAEGGEAARVAERAMPPA